MTQKGIDGLRRFLPPATKLGQGNIFTGVCDSVNGGGVPAPGGGACSVGSGLGGVWSWGGSGPRGVPGGDPPGWPLLRAVRILLECILVRKINFQQNLIDFWMSSVKANRN